jgi:rhodanese-related sulfurtransferase
VTLALRILGYTDVRNLAGGVAGWIAAEFPVVK